MWEVAGFTHVLVHIWRLEMLALESEKEFDQFVIDLLGFFKLSSK